MIIMKVLIWIGCFFCSAIVQLIFRYSGIVLGGIPTALLFAATWFLATLLCKKWDAKKESGTVTNVILPNEEEKQSNRSFVYTHPMKLNYESAQASIKQYEENCKNAEKRKYNKTLIIVIALSAALVISLAINVGQFISDNGQEPTNNNKESTNKLEELPTPSNGHTFQNIDIIEGSAPLTINTVGTGGYYFVLDPLWISYGGDSPRKQQYAELSAKYSYIKIYVKAGSTVQMQIPLGEYEIYYATGDKWYGEDALFGEDTVYSKCDDTFVFSQAYGWTLELTPIINGNLDVDKIDKKDFPN